jgi:hypothetical protein
MSRRTPIVAILIVFLAGIAPTAGAQPSPSSCRTDPGYAALDFWLGTWRVYVGSSLDGVNHIEKILDGCAILEHWDDADGSHGKSLFFYNPSSKAWKQVWIQEDGQLKEKTRVEDPAPGAVRFRGEMFLGPGRTVQDRTTLTPLPGGRVRQVIETSRDGTTWRTGFDAVYIPAGEGEGPSAGPSPKHDLAFWRGIEKNHFEVPAGESADALVQELGDSLGSTNPELRDDFGYTIVAEWVYKSHRVSEKTLHELVKRWQGNLEVGLGAKGSDTLFLRAFSALDLSILAALDNDHPFLGDKEYADLLTSTLSYLAGEKDLRAYDGERGWMHATAHTADLLKFLARSSRLRPEDQKRILDTVAGKVHGAGEVFTHGENERLAAAIGSLVRRQDFDPAAFTAFTAALVEPANHLFDHGPLIDSERFAAMQNGKDLLRSLYIYLLQRKATAGPAQTEILKALEKFEG